jgi:hypothetical protein
MAIRKFSTASISAGTNKSTKLWDQETFQSGMFALATVSLTSNASSVIFTGIPSNYTHLQVRVFARSNYAGTGDTLKLEINGDTTASYTGHYMYGNSANALAGAYGTLTGYMVAGSMPAANLTSGIFGASMIDILDYSNTTKNKVIREIDGIEPNAANGTIFLRSGLWLSTSAINALKFTIDNGTGMVPYSHFALYGIKAA